MLRLLKKYTFGYHVLSTTPALIPSRSIIMSSYPGALSSHDEFYLIQGEDRELIIAGTPLTVTNRNLRNFMNAKDQVSEKFFIVFYNFKFITDICVYVSKDIYVKPHDETISILNRFLLSITFLGYGKS